MEACHPPDTGSRSDSVGDKSGVEGALHDPLHDKARQLSCEPASGGRKHHRLLHHRMVLVVVMGEDESL